GHGIYALFDERRDHVRRTGIEVVAGPVEVHGQKEDRLEIVLLTIRLRLHEQHLLGRPIRRVRLLRIAIPEIILSEWHWRELGIRAHGADGDQLGNAEQPCLFHELGSHHQVVVEEAPRILAIGADTADNGSEMDDQIRTDILQQGDNVDFLPEVVLGAPRYEWCWAAATTEGSRHEGAKKSRASRDNDTL